MSFLGILKKKPIDKSKELVFNPIDLDDDFLSFPTPEELKAGKAKIKPPVKPRLEKLERFPDAFEKDAVKSQKKELEMFEEHAEVKKPIFVRIELFRDIIDEIGISRSILHESNDILTRVSGFKHDEDKEFNKWQMNIQDIQKKLIYVDKVLFGKIEEDKSN